MLVQVAGNGLSTYGLFYFLAVPGAQVLRGDGAETGESVALIFAVVTITALAATLVAGRVSDLIMRRKPFLVVSAAVMAAGLATMAMAGDWTAAALGYGVATVGMSVFLATQSALAMQLLPSPEHRGRDIGILNLTNTLPAMVAPLLALVLDPEKAGYGPWLAVLSGGVVIGGLVALSVKTER